MLEKAQALYWNSYGTEYELPTSRIENRFLLKLGKPWPCVHYRRIVYHNFGMLSVTEHQSQARKRRLADQGGKRNGTAAAGRVQAEKSAESIWSHVDLCWTQTTAREGLTIYYHEWLWSRDLLKMQEHLNRWSLPSLTTSYLRPFRPFLLHGSTSESQYTNILPYEPSCLSVE